MRSLLSAKGLGWLVASILFAAAAFDLPTAAQAQATAITPETSDHVQHFFDCFGAMFSNPTLHQQDCSPGNAVPAGPPATMTGPGCPTTVGMISFGDAVQVAALDSDFGGTFVHRAPAQQVATIACGCHPIDYRPAPGNVQVLSASLDSTTGTPPVVAPSARLVAGSCCFAQATPKSLVPPGDVAMIGSDLDPRMLTTPTGTEMRVAIPCCYGDVVGLPVLVPGPLVASLDPALPAPVAPASSNPTHLHLAC